MSRQKEPNISEIRLRLGIPKEAKMLGWAIHAPETDEFVGPYSSKEFMRNIGWVLAPDLGKRFKTMKKAVLALEDLELDGRAVPVPLFDMGRTIIVGFDRPSEADESENPFRRDDLL